MIPIKELITDPVEGEYDHNDNHEHPTDQTAGESSSTAGCLLSAAGLGDAGVRWVGRRHVASPPAGNLTSSTLVEASLIGSNRGRTATKKRLMEG